ncbi:NAD(P)/FAD-dependent oxidoreductase [Konateibacter massiliensis]|uniref:NAD(P)/FAD-dependent oxidoreductase n=1 Tax=Konateibacter massiliensis TaxID=2002841 RepID=UPI000C148783|nr:NAD(P)/FAD-dependent oxidoreductase [Konateibacter massiliensis]
MQRYDIAIIGTGPAGLSAAITAKIRNKSILLIGNKDLSTKVQKAHTIQNYLGLSVVGGEDLGKAFQEHLDKMEIEITEEKVNAIYNMGDYFGIQGADEIYEADSVVLATGVVLGKPYPGEIELLGKGVSYCATCDAPLYRNKTVAIIGFSPKEEAEAEFMAEIAKKVYYVPRYKEEVSLSEAIEVVREVPKAICGTQQVEMLQTRENNYVVDGVFILRESVAPSQLVPGLETEDNHVVVNRQMETSMEGCFACGDIVGKPYQYIKSAGEGNIAALSAVSYLDKKKRERKSA